MTYFAGLYPGDPPVLACLETLGIITALIAFTWLAERLTARRCPARQHALWITALIGVLAAPGLSMMGRQLPWRLGVLHSEVTPSSEVTTHADLVDLPQIVPAPVDVDIAIPQPVAPSITAEPAVTPQLIVAHRLSWRDWTVVAFLAWSLGSIYLMARLAHGWVRVRHLLRQARPIESDELAAVVRKLGNAPLPQLCSAAGVASPMVAGLLAPRIILPEQLFESCSPQQIREILIHECAHVVRRDLWVRLLQRTTEILFWVHPLVHFLNRRLDQAREEVCDNHVLAQTDAPSYAETLLMVAQRCQPARRLVGALTMMPRRYKLEHRVAEMLDHRRDLATRLPNRQRIVTVMSLVVLLAMLACVGVQSKSSAQDKKAPAAPPATKPAVPASDSFTFAGRVLNMDGQPVAGAKVHIAGHKPGIEFQERTVSGVDGSYRFTIHRDEFDSKVIARGREPLDLWLYVGAFANGYGATSVQAILPEERENLTLWLPQEEVAHCRVVDDAGKPVTGVRVSAYLVNGGRLNTDRKPVSNKAASKGRQWSVNFVPYEKGRHADVSDADGKVTLRGLSRDWRYGLSISSPTIVSQARTLVTHPQNPQDRQKVPGVSARNSYDSTFDVTVSPCKPIVGLVREQGSGKLLSDIEITVRPGGNDGPWIHAKTDNDGRYLLTGLPHGAHRLIVRPPTTMPYVPTEITAHAVQAGFAPMTLDIELPRQPAIAGRLIDSSTGQSVRGHVVYRPLATNQNLADHPSLLDRSISNSGITANTDNEGRFLLPVLAGPGVILVQANEPYAPARLAKEHRVKGIAHHNDPELIDCRPHAAWPQEFHAYQLVDVAADQVSKIDIKLTPAKARPLIIEYPDSAPTDTSVQGLIPHDQRGGTYHAGLTAITGLVDDEKRRLFVATRDHKFSATSTVRGSESGPVVVKLKPNGTITGRVVDGEGKPITNSTFQLLYDDGPGRPGHLIWGGIIYRLPTPAELERDGRIGRSNDPNQTKFVSSMERTDDSGNFRVGGVCPDLAFDLNIVIIKPNTVGQRIVEGKGKIARATVKPGETLDLGELKLSVKPLTSRQEVQLNDWIRALQGLDTDKRFAAAAEIGLMGSAAKAAGPALRAIMASERGDLPADAAAIALWRVDKESYAQILKNRNYNSRERWQAVMSLYRLGTDAKELVPIVLEIAADEKDRGPDREHALFALGYIGADPALALPVLLKGFHHGQYARLMSAQALGQFGDKAKDAIPDLHEALTDVDPLVRAHVAGAVWNIGGDRPRALSVLMASLQGKDGQELTGRQLAVYYLTKIGPPAKEAFPSLLELWKAETGDDVTAKYNREHVAAALKTIDAKAAEAAGVK